MAGMVQPSALKGSRSRGAGGVPRAGNASAGRLGEPRKRRVAVMVPMSGSAGIWGPSSISCAQLAINEINAGNGAGGREVDPVWLDADDSAMDETTATLEELVADEAIDAVVGMHVSSVRQRLKQVVRGRIPYVYTPLYEGGEQSPAIFTIGETPHEYLGPVLRDLAARLKLRRWALVGNDYVWPRASHHYAKQAIAEFGGQVVFETYVPFGIEEPVELVEKVAATRPDMVFVSLIGQDAVEFNRVFGSLDLDRKAARFSTAIEENVLLATGADFTKRLYAASSYFSTLATQRNLAFKERYHSLHRERAPVLNSLGQSMYEGMHFYAALAQAGPARTGPLHHVSARGGCFLRNDLKQNPIFLARADGHLFTVLDRLG